jgi:8-oxo-dGTP pyrophosphatase MutT (NUDIX family)
MQRRNTKPPAHPPRDNLAARFPVSVKGVLFHDARVVLLRNERDEWELPGGKLEPSESPESCLEREIAEELAVDAKPEALIDCWLYAISDDTQVVIVTFGCRGLGQPPQSHSDEHDGLGLFELEQLPDLAMPDGYKRSIARWAQACTDI